MPKESQSLAVCQYRSLSSHCAGGDCGFALPISAALAVEDASRQGCPDQPMRFVFSIAIAGDFYGVVGMCTQGGRCYKPVPMWRFCVVV